MDNLTIRQEADARKLYHSTLQASDATWGFTISRSNNHVFPILPRRNEDSKDRKMVKITFEN